MIEPVHLSSDEPLGHGAPYTKIERAWATMPRGSALTRVRVERFDSTSSILYAPMEYRFDSVPDLRPSQPQRDWIESAFRAFVRGEFPARKVDLAYRALGLNIVDERVVGFDFLERVLGRFEDELVYNGRLDPLIELATRDMTAAVIEVLCDPLLGHVKNRQNLDLRSFRALVERQVEDGDRLMFIVPSFPFKDQNPFRTLSEPHAFDLGELGLMLRLHALALALYQVHPFGADMVVLSDGRMYAETFGVKRSEADKYREQLRAFRNLLNIQGTVSVLDLESVLDHFTSPVDRSSPVWDTKQHIAGHIRELAKGDGQAAASFLTLKQGMKWNLRSREELANLSLRRAWDLLTSINPPDVAPSLRALWTDLDERAMDAAVDYAATNLTVRYLDLLQLVFPGTIRATVHPKKGQVALARAGSAYPWNGSAYVDDGDVGPSSIISLPAYQLAPQRLVLVRLDMTGEPLFFRSAEDGSGSINQLSAALHDGPTTATDGYGLRRLVPEDYDDLHGILAASDEMTWERQAASPEYSRNLLDFRLDHYAEFGFGVYAVVADADELVGQAGFQVLGPKADDRVELVIFLAHGRMGAGLGSTIARDLIGVAAEAGLTVIYGTSRFENERAESLIRKLDFEAAGETENFGYPCRLWALTL